MTAADVSLPLVQRSLGDNNSLDNRASRHRNLFTFCLLTVKNGCLILLGRLII